MLIASVFEEKAIAKVFGPRPQSALGFLVRRQRDLDRVVLERAHRDVQLDRRWRDLRKAARPLPSQFVLQREGASVVQQDVSELLELAPQSGLEHGSRHLRERPLEQPPHEFRERRLPQLIVERLVPDR
jgi:hypothetical protein